MKRMKKIFNWIFDKIEEPVPEPTPEWRSYEYYDKAYDERHNYLKSLMTGAAEKETDSNTMRLLIKEANKLMKEVTK